MFSVYMAYIQRAPNAPTLISQGITSSRFLLITNNTSTWQQTIKPSGFKLPQIFTCKVVFIFLWIRWGYTCLIMLMWKLNHVHSMENSTHWYMMHIHSEGPLHKIKHYTLELLTNRKCDFYYNIILTLFHKIDTIFNIDCIPSFECQYDHISLLL